MIDYTLGFIGAGNMSGAILGGVLRDGLLPPERIILSNPTPGKLEQPARLGVRVTAGNAEAADFSDIIILGIKPQMFDAVLPQLSGHVAGKCVVSLAPGVSVAWLKNALPGAYVMRVMPNTPLLVGRGATVIARAEDVPKEIYDAVYAVFAAAGEVAVLPEEQINASIAVSGSSPAYFFRIADAMVAEAARQGMDPELALRLTARAMEGAAVMLQESGKTARELTAQVCSPGGTTLAALSAFDELGLDAMLAEAMRRCVKRALELAK